MVDGTRRLIAAVLWLEAVGGIPARNAHWKTQVTWTENVKSVVCATYPTLDSLLIISRSWILRGCYVIKKNFKPY